jgi:hypothetical protein
MDKINYKLNEMIIGLLLGDSSINKSGRLIFEQSIKHLDYIMHLYEEFYDYTDSLPKFYKRYDYRYDKFNYSIYFKTLPNFYYYYDLFMVETENKNTIKIVPENVYDLLTPIGLAYWIMDDGQYNGKKAGITLCTDNFSFNEVLALKYVLQNKFKLECSIHNKNRQKNHYRIYILKSSVPLLQLLVNDYIHASLKYKIKF